MILFILINFKHLKQGLKLPAAQHLPRCSFDFPKKKRKVHSEHRIFQEQLTSQYLFIYLFCGVQCKSNMSDMQGKSCGIKIIQS